MECTSPLHTFEDNSTLRARPVPSKEDPLDMEGHAEEQPTSSSPPPSALHAKPGSKKAGSKSSSRSKESPKKSLDVN
eukprot:2039152-Pyramimonas_sp.AAC.1